MRWYDMCGKRKKMTYGATVNIQMPQVNNNHMTVRYFLIKPLSIQKYDWT